MLDLTVDEARLLHKLGCEHVVQECVLLGWFIRRVTDEAILRQEHVSFEDARSLWLSSALA